MALRGRIAPVALLGFAALAPLAGCAAVPSLTFETDEGGTADAGDAARASDAPASPGDAGCPDLVPPGAVVCCGPIPCFGSFCNATNCAACAACAPTETCCPRNANSAQCLRAGTVCH